MSHFRFSLFGLLTAISIVAIFCAAVAAGTQLWLYIVFTATLSVLLIAAMLAWVEQGQPWALCLGFTIFGGVYFLLALAPFFGAHTSSLLPSNIVLDLIHLPSDNSPMIRIGSGNEVDSPARYIVHFGAALMFGLLGALGGNAVWWRKHH
jgi:hypothetical protein